MIDYNKYGKAPLNWEEKQSINQSITEALEGKTTQF